MRPNAKAVKWSRLVPCLLHALFLETDAGHPRRGMDEAIRAGVQRDGAECVLQVALFGAGEQLPRRVRGSRGLPSHKRSAVSSSRSEVQENSERTVYDP
jgi:hypothetical protein